ncbi:hypothetical protein [Burkholderia ambifaria]|uniref:hypothetical protein n=1 Tax=Burkholderia ambifaria TaxID=152480 RepID=UPI00158B2652|nr:hypothetical protein [Burkholderia ambifaria]
MHRETNLQVENEETIEAQSARTPKRCWTESNSAFSFVCANFPRWCSEAAPRSARLYSASHCPRFTPVLPFSSCLPVDRPLARSRVHAVRAYPVGVRKRRPLHSAFADRAVGKIGRQFSYKQNAEEGVRLDEKRRTMDRGTTGGWRRSYGVGSAWVCPRFREPFCGRYACSGAIGRYGSFSGRCVRIQMNCRSSDLAPPERVAESALAGRSADDRCLRIDRFPAKPPFRACFILTTLLPRIVTVERPLRNARRRTRAFHGKTSVGAAWRDS